jgi:two-component system, cell cycle response regulator
MSANKPPSKVEQTRAVDAEPRSVRRHGIFTVATGLEAGRVLAIPSGAPVSLGRAPECTFSFDDESLSREHALVIRAGGDYLFKDCSTNGSFVNDARLAAPAILRDGDRVQLGTDTFLRFAFVDPEEEATLRRVYEAAILDGLTGIFNRKHLEERIAAELGAAIRHGRPLSVVIVDVDHFKKVNDTYGHLAGDAVLKQVASLLTRSVRPGDIVARYGGEEFVILARDAALADAVVVAERFRSTVREETITFEAHAIRVTSSAGVASLACCGESPDRSTLLATADRRLYAAKQGGRDRVVASG